MQGQKDARDVQFSADTRRGFLARSGAHVESMTNMSIRKLPVWLFKTLLAPVTGSPLRSSDLPLWMHGWKIGIL